jgi:phenylacetate-CoA ligase
MTMMPWELAMTEIVDIPANPTTMRSPDDLEPIETASRDEITALQLTRLKWSLQHAYDNVAHYRHAFDQAGAHPSDLKDLSDLSLFPFTTKADMRQNYPFGMFAVPQSQIVRVHASSGTTGRPTVVGYTAADIDTWANLVARCLRAAGVRSTDKVHIAYGYGLFTGGLGAHYGAERLGCTVIPMSGGMTERQVQLITDFQPDAIMVTPSYMLTLVDAMERAGTDPRLTSLRTGIFGAEPWTDQMRAELERTLDMNAVDIYGLSELIGPGVAQECVETKDGLHIWEDHFYPEIIDPQTGQVLPDGSEGELVFTSLTKQALPIVRYRTRDLTALLPGTARTMRRIHRIAGRCDDMIILRGVNLFPSQIEELILGIDAFSSHFQCVLDRSGRLDTLTVRVESRPGATPDQRLSAAATLTKQIKNRIGVTVIVDVVEPRAVERSEGKAKRLIDNRPKG